MDTKHLTDTHIARFAMAVGLGMDDKELLDDAGNKAMVIQMRAMLSQATEEEVETMRKMALEALEQVRQVVVLL